MNDAAIADSPTRLPLRFVGSGSEYFRIWIVKLLLTLVTLGLYYPFAKVRRLKYFHGATELAGQPFSFHADPWKMLRGYLLVGAMLALYGVAAQVSPTAGLVALAIVAAAWPALWQSSLRFRFANTGWRGLRFHFSGTRGGAYKVYGWAALGFGAVFGLLLGTSLLGASVAQGEGDGSGAAGWLAVLPALLMMLLYFTAMPVFLWLVHGYRQRHLGLGGEQAAWSVRPGAYVKLALKTLGVGVLPLAAVGVAAAVLLPAMQGRSAGSGAVLGALALLVLVYVVAIAVAGGFFAARLQDLMWNGTRSAHVVIVSSLSARATIGLWIRNWLLTIVTLGLYFPFARVAMARLRLQAVTVELTLPVEELTAQLQGTAESAAGDAAGDLLGWDIGL
ncbi:MAG: YjgN family protein [Rubrivivax sp.]